ncbi:hypothetical protein IU421_30250 [Nocardia cyriacigeorgica]|uniref:hypothetical protein n=1 Tax=Nocardia cyriacigeorgica TaxID=135487 RepID=UPI001893235A|nr:hypothetical protein [Nocardia cyriacigeorgica]MBF6163067.1 hypothetical protein [Nocardia cyriacigeorgica]MBF6202035.1 hypothetical protein [Nocardia cyriacigeorgica]MBF6518529.1 hypothetical protein [Nocardia cyriacigeorgica]
MNTTIRTFLTVVAADAAVLGALYAWDQHQNGKADNKFRAARQTPPVPAKPMTAAEHAELGRLKRYSSGTVNLPDYFPSRAAYLEAAAGYNIDLLDGEAVELASMSVQQLIAEVTHAKTNLRNCRRTRFDYSADSSAVEMWIEHLEALRAEFDFRFEHRQTQPELDRTRLEVASAGVHTHTDEWPPYGLSGTKTTVNAYATKAVEAGAESTEDQE